MSRNTTGTATDSAAPKGRNTDSENSLHPQIEFSGDTKLQSGLRKMIPVLAVLFFITTAIFVALFTVYFIKYNQQASSSDKVCGTTDCIKTASSSDKVCGTTDCIKTASRIASKMNLTADPCVNFPEYACGSFYKEAYFPEGRTSVTAFSALGDSNYQIMKDIITEEIKEGEPLYLTNMKRYYISCMNEDAIEQTGLKPFLTYTDITNEWPTLNPMWMDTNFNLADVIARYAQVYIAPIFSFNVYTDLTNSSQTAIYIEDPTLGLTPEYFSRARNDTVILAYQKYLADFAIELGASTLQSEQDAEEIVDIEIALSKIMVPKEQRRDYMKQYNPTTLAELSTMFPDLDIPRTLTAAFSTVNINLSEDQKIIVSFPTYISNISMAIKDFSNRALQNLFAFKYALSSVEGLTRRLRAIRLEFYKVFIGKREESPRWEECLSSTSSAFSSGMGKQYVTRAFHKTDKLYVEKMVDNLKNAFKQMINESTWMGHITKQEVYKKLAAMKQQIGYPDTGFEDADIEAKYGRYNMTDDDYYANRVLTYDLANRESLLSLQKDKFLMVPYEVGAYYYALTNSITFPAGILHAPFFSQIVQDSINYGAIGVIIGHEITHGFDDAGSQFDAEGKLRNWWQKSDREKFLKRTECVVDQYSSFYVQDVQMNVNGIHTQGESVADNGGLKESYKAYKEIVRISGEQPTLPGLGLSQDQLFFLAYGQLWCEKITKELMTLIITVDEHPPSYYRLIGALQNSEDFAKAYKCTAGSYMHPEKKCNVW